MVHFHYFTRERTKPIHVFSYPPVVHRGNIWVYYILRGWCYFPLQFLSLLLSVFFCSFHLLSILFFIHNYKIQIISWGTCGFSTYRDAGPCHTHLPAPDVLGGFHCRNLHEEWGEVQTPHWVPPSSLVALGRQMGHLQTTFSPGLCEASSAPLV